MYEIIKEGTAKIKVKKIEKISKKMEVFYNPVMKTNRDISILLLNSVENQNMQIALPLAGSGIRGIRFLKELKKVKIKNISFNDHSKKAFEGIKRNLRLNNIKNFSIIKKPLSENLLKNKKIKVYDTDANIFMLNSSGFDYIDIDPFGSPNIFLDIAVKRISRNGILAITATDTAALTGTYAKATLRKYWAVAKRDEIMHETGLRILIRKVQLIGSQYEKAFIPIFSYFKEHYYRVFFRCIKGKKDVDKIIKMHGMFNNVGPLWLGNLWDKKLVDKIYNSILKINNKEENKELIKFLKIINDEAKISSVGFFDINEITERKKIKRMIKKGELIKKIKEKGFRASETHFSGTGIRSDIPYKRVIAILKK